MSIDTGEAIDAAARAAFTDWVEADEATGADLWASDRVRALLNNADDWRQVITAALPHIERQVRMQVTRERLADAFEAQAAVPTDERQIREQVAREIEAASAPDPLTRSLAARIARGEQP